MAGEIIKTQGIVLAVYPWSRTSHVVTWLTPDHGPVTTLVKGAVRPKSAFLGQYDLFYTCDLLYYARATADLHALREVTPHTFRENLRGRWRETALAGYAAGLVKDLAPANAESAVWFSFLEELLTRLENAPTTPPLQELVRLEMEILQLAGWAPDFTDMDPHAEWSPFAIDLGRCGEGARTVRLSPRTVGVLVRPDASSHALETVKDAVRFLGVFLAYHIERPPDIRRALVSLLLE
ncbi:MAG: DNA repair protein RecO [Kiritimatiellae bacterium]|nr:DNA repair protein RecO [Kiritimatiellia bacterium]